MISQANISSDTPMGGKPGWGRRYISRLGAARERRLYQWYLRRLIHDGTGS